MAHKVAEVLHLTDKPQVCTGYFLGCTVFSDKFQAGSPPETILMMTVTMTSVL
jgi:hypothetical protein